MENNDALETLMSHPVMTNIKSGRSMDIQTVMAISLNWAYDQSISNNMPLGLSNAIQLANEYRSETNSIAEASNNLLKYEIPKISGFGFLHSLSGNSSLISNIPSVLLLQLRLVNAIAHLAEHDLNDEK